MSQKIIKKRKTSEKSADKYPSRISDITVTGFDFNTQIRNIFIVWNTNKYQVSQVSKEKLEEKSGYRRQF